jgi:predicted PhzF superfamily epimerase YddE/YHI9
VASQGTAIGRRGRIHITRDPSGTIWIAGNTVTCVNGTANL